MENREKKKAERTQCDYTMSFKLGIVSYIEKAEFTYKQAQKNYGIQWRSTVLVWLRKYDNLDWSKPIIHTMSQSKETSAEKIKRLEKELSDEKLKTKVLNMMIDISYKQYGKRIRKKFTPKQSDNSRKKDWVYPKSVDCLG